VKLPKTPVGIAYVAALGGALLSALALSAALWAAAARKPAVLLVRGNDDPKVVTPGLVPDALARDFARDFIATLENYVPSTLEENARFLETRVAPQGYHEFRRLTESLARLVKESRQASQLTFENPRGASVLREGSRLEVFLQGLRRIYVEGALLQEARVSYRVALVAGQPSRQNPTGLAVAGFSIKIAPEEKRDEKAD
jgi:hypothetical protein